MPGNEEQGLRADAVLVPHEYPEGFQEMGRMIELARRISPLFGGKRIAVGNDMEDQTQQFVRPEGFDPAATTRNFPNEHPLRGRSRYDWFVARESEPGKYEVLAPVLGLPGDSREVRLGYLVDEQALLNERRAARTDPAYEAALAAAANDPATKARLARSGLLPGQAPADVAARGGSLPRETTGKPSAGKSA